MDMSCHAPPTTERRPGGGVGMRNSRSVNCRTQCQKLRGGSSSLVRVRWNLVRERGRGTGMCVLVHEERLGNIF